MFAYAHIAAFYRSRSNLHRDCPACEEALRLARAFETASGLRRPK